MSTPAERPIASWEEAPLAELVAHLVGTYHLEARMILEGLSHHAWALPESELIVQIRSHLAHLDRDLRGHLSLEEEALFPALLAMAEGRPTDILPQAVNPTTILEMEHVAVSELLQNIRVLTSDYEVPENAEPALKALYEGFAALDESLQRHLYLESQVLFPRACPSA